MSRPIAVLCILLAVSSALFAQSAPAPDEAAIKQIVDGIMLPYIQQDNPQGAIVGVSLHGHRYFFPYGKARDDGMPFAPDTLVEIGSCTKTFTTTLFALAIGRKQMDPNASAQNYMPEGYTLTKPAQAMTPLELADFTSGLPDDPPHLPPRLAMRSIEHYTTRDFLTWLSRWRPETTLPAPFLYSNAGIGVLGYLIEKATATTWEQQLEREILQTLTMPDTTLRPTPQQMRRMARGHTPNGSDAPPWPVFAWYAAGGLRSTAQDMISFGEANLGHSEVNGNPVPPELTAAMKLAQTPIYTLPRPINKQAMAWVNNVGNGNPNIKPVILKDGGTAGFGTTIAISPTKDAAVFIGVNQSRSQTTPKAVEIMRRLP